MYLLKQLITKGLKSAAPRRRQMTPTWGKDGWVRASGPGVLRQNTPHTTSHCVNVCHKVDGYARCPGFPQWFACLAGGAALQALVAQACPGSQPANPGVIWQRISRGLSGLGLGQAGGVTFVVGPALAGEVVQLASARRLEVPAP